MALLQLKLETLNSKAFAPFGDVIEVSDDNTIIAINYGLTERHHDLANVDVGEAGKPLISLFRSQPVSLPFQIKVMERHPLGSQAFMGLSGNPYLVVVAPRGDFDAGALRAFVAQAQQGVNYHPGTWHHYCLGLNTTNDFLVVDRGGDGPNCDEETIPQELIITVDYQAP
jgi:ureidoglycolate lyase